MEGRERPEPGHEPAAAVNCVSPQYFETVTTRVLSGRVFNERDTATSTKVFVISQATAKGLFGNEDPIGRRLAQAEGENLRWGEIVGVVSDVKAVVEKPSPVIYQIYQPMAQEPRRKARSPCAPSELLRPPSSRASARRWQRSIRTCPCANSSPRKPRSTAHHYELRVLRNILAAFAVLGLGLASLGIYGVIARTMAQRAGEFAIRLALGASIENITRMVLASGVKLALFGSTIGLLGAFGVSRLLAAGFPGMRMNGAVILIGATLLLIAIALVACWLPARRAGRIDAMSLLRAE